MIALCIGLREAGEDAFLAAPPENAEWADSYGVPFKPVGGNLREAIGSFPDLSNLTAVNSMARFLRREIRRQFVELPKILQGSDLILGASLIFAASSVAEMNNKPYRFISFCPQIIPSIRHAPPLIRKQNLPEPINTILWMSLRRLDLFGFKGILNRNRKRLGLKPVDDPYAYFIGPEILLASDPALAPAPEQNRFRVVQTGYMHLEQKEELECELLDFIEAGPPPVYFGFGSMPGMKEAAVGRILRALVKQSGLRFILSKGWADLGRGITNDNCYITRDTPHLKLFPRVAAVIHHGGAGTTATAARSGVPQVIIPQVLDQYYWAEKVFRLGLGPEPIGITRLNGENLLHAVRLCVSDTGYKTRAIDIAAELAESTPLKRAIDYIRSIPEKPC